MNPVALNRRERAEALFYFYALNLVLLLVVGHGYLTKLPPGTSILGWTQTLFAYLANFAMWALVPLLLSLAAVCLPWNWLTLTITVIAFGSFNIFIYIDSVLYQLWNFHFNGFVFNLLTTPGASDSVTAGASTILSTALIVASIFGAEIILALWVLPRLKKLPCLPRLNTGKALGYATLAIAGLIFLDKAIYDVGDLRQDSEVVRLRHLLPLYQTVTVKRFASRTLGLNVSKSLNLHGKSGSLNYPKAPLQFRPDGPRPNIIVVALEGARFDACTPDVMPHMYQWGEQHLVFDNNFSAGNATRYGIFGLIYGIPGTYWQRFLAEQRGPVLIQSLKQLGYNFRILCCTDLNYPEFRSTAFVDVPNAITDTWTGDRTERDRQMTDEFVKFVEKKRSPYFTFLFYDASHQPYHYPPEHAIFDTDGVTEQINYVRLAHDKSQLPFIHNRYKNSLHYIDSLLGPALDKLGQEGLLENTIIYIAGDHGEEFDECGLFGHDSAFDRYQTKTMTMASIPGQTSRHITNLTSHIDLPSTILNYMGVENPLSDYTQGQPLTSGKSPPYLLLSSWGIAAVVDPQTIITFGLEAYNADTIIADTNNIPLPNQRQELATRTDRLISVLQSMKEFTK